MNNLSAKLKPQRVLLVKMYVVAKKIIFELLYV